MSDFIKTQDGDGIATITWDCANRPMNVMSEQGFVDLNELVENCISDQSVTGVIITSAKKDFAAGMDLGVIAKTKEKNPDNPAQGCFEMVMHIHKILRKIELAGMDLKSKKGGKPFVAVLPGTALGIGFEIPLACHHIIAADNPKAKIGLPEIKVGIFPGAGGTTRLVRKMGAMAASPFLLEGKLSDPKAALTAGLIDAVSEHPIKDAKKWILEAKDTDLIKVWDSKGYKMPGGTPYHPGGFMTFVGASAMVNGNTFGVYPAAKALLSAAYEGALVPFDTALKIEARYFTSVLVNPSSSNMIRSLFLNKGALEKGAVRPDGVSDQSVKKVGIMGAGMMGAGIALVTAQAGIDVVMIDQVQENADKGKAYIASYCDKGIKRKKTTLEQKEAMLGRVNATTNYADLADCDLIIEAVFEDLEVKAEVTKNVEAVVNENCIFATNTSTLPISDLAKASIRPEQFIGIHFFSPVEKMLLVEIIKGKKTEDRAVAKALDYARQIRKTPIVVNDARFFYANRCIIPYINEGIRMVKEGIEPALIENAAKLMGMPLGPLQLNDETSIDLGVKIAQATKAALGSAYDNQDADEVLFWLFNQGRLGRKSAAGYYEYDEKGKRVGIWQGLKDQYTKKDKSIDLLEVQHRLMFVQVLEAVRALEEGVLMDVREGDVGAILGWGFAPWSGGPLSWFDMLGSEYAAARCDELEVAYGSRFAAPSLLRDMANTGEAFYDKLS
jgi:3-hydroxyacyl-CoA dehydrogenase/enoyl-CoA hydratase/3-hydroxybutyryl-CoA epimerase|tara:strand:- start:1265 stop:3445 length:2181 start_codon:yes stop_codon:yes gene_type:complete